MKFVTCAAVLTVAALCGLASATVHSKSGDSKYKYTWKDALYVPCSGNATLRADAFVPTPNAPGEKFPVVIFPNSWSCPQIEYITRALGLAERGYIGFEYETRGWFISGGVIDTAGPIDRDDGSRMIDFVASKAAEWNADMSKVAFMGISYGAGISIMMAGHDERVKTAVSMSGWNNMTLMMYGNESPNTDTLQGLVNVAERKGNISAELQQIVNDIELHRNMSAFSAFTEQRSPQIFLDSLNARNVPLFLSNNFMDHLFRPQYMLDFFGLLTSPKMLLLNQGTHALPEGMGIVFHDNYIWSHALRWLDHWLKNASNGIMDEPKIRAQLGDSVLDSEYVALSRANISTTSLWLTPVVDGFGGLGTAPPMAGGVSAPIHFTKDVGLREGSGKDMSFGKPDNVSLVQPANTTFVFVSDAIDAVAPTTLCGTVELDMRVVTSGDDWQLFTYMYLLPPGASTAYGSLWTRGFYTHYLDGPTAGPVAARNADGSWSVKGAQLHTICKTIPAGYRLALGVVLFDKNFTPASEESTVAFAFGESTVLRIPRVVPSQP